MKPINIPSDNCIFCGSEYKRQVYDYYRCSSCDKSWKFIDITTDLCRFIYYQFGEAYNNHLVLSITDRNNWVILTNGIINAVHGDNAMETWKLDDLEALKDKVELYHLMS